jgi:hypothetical protein
MKSKLRTHIVFVMFAYVQEAAIHPCAALHFIKEVQTSMKEDIKNIAGQLKKELDPTKEQHQKLVQKGLLLFRQHSVYQRKALHNAVTAKVQDVTPVTVILDLADVQKSDCSCPFDGICRHKMALFFSLYSENDSVFHWVQSWKESNDSLDILKQIKRGSDLLAEKSPAPISDVELWLHRFEHAYEDADLHSPYSYEHSIRKRYEKLIAASPIEREWKPLYQLFVIYESFKQINKICIELHHNWSRSFFQFMLEEAADALDSLSVSAFPFAFDPYLAYLRENSAFLLEEDTYFTFEFIELYRMLWTSLIKQLVWRKLEFDRLQTIPTASHNERIRIASIHLAILCGYDDEALIDIEHSDENITLFAPYWLNYFKDKKAYAQVYRYLNAILPFVPEFIRNQSNDQDRSAFIRLFLRTLDENMLAERNVSLLEKLYVQLLPFSFYHFNDYLFTQKKYREWAELQNLRGNDISDIEKWRIDAVAKETPQVLLPLYHEAIDKLLLNKNRDSYKKTVKYLKKLRTLYKKQKRVEVWSAFFEDLMNKTKRLRAFHEECRKGKLINA